MTTQEEQRSKDETPQSSPETPAGQAESDAVSQPIGDSPDASPAPSAPATSDAQVAAVESPPAVSESATAESASQQPEAATPPAPAEATPPAGEPAAVPAEPAVEVPAEAPAGSAAANSALDRMRSSQPTPAADKPVGNVDLQAQRPDIPTNAAPVDIPDADDSLTDALEAEISAAMANDTVAPVTTVPVPAEEAYGGDTEAADAATDAAPAETEEIGPGSSVTGSVQHIHGDDVFINAGLLFDVVVPLKQFPEGQPPAVGNSVTAIVDTVDADGMYRARLPQARTKTGGNWDSLAEGQVVDCQVTGTNKGGLQVLVSNIKGFLPASQVDLGYVADLEQYVGQKLSVKITEVKPKKKNLVVSRRVLLQEEREGAQAGFWETLEVGQDHTGTVKTLKNYGAFVNLGPIDGFLHVGEISWSRINHPNEVLKEGMEVQVRILKIDREKNRISLSMKQLVQNPWMGLAERYPSERIVGGKVSRVADFGAFVELEPGVEGLVHISELAWRRVGSVNEVLKIGDERDFKVLEVDQRRRRVSLSLKALEAKPEPIAKAEAEQEARPPRRENPDLRGGTGGSKDGGGLFGNPSDFT